MAISFNYFEILGYYLTYGINWSSLIQNTCCWVRQWLKISDSLQKLTFSGSHWFISKEIWKLSVAKFSAQVQGEAMVLGRGVATKIYSDGRDLAFGCQNVATWGNFQLCSLPKEMLFPGTQGVKKKKKR